MERLLNLNSKVGNHDSEEIKLVRKAVKGDAEAFTEVIKKYKLYLYRIAYAYVKDEEKALDILQECAFKAFLNITKLKEAGYFKTWITRILINISLGTIKKDSGITPLEENTALCCEAEGVAIEQKLDLYNAIDLLRKDYKSVIILKYFNDMTISNISAVMEIPESTVKTYLRRAKESLCRILKEDYLNE